MLFVDVEIFLRARRSKRDVRASSRKREKRTVEGPVDVRGEARRCRVPWSEGLAQIGRRRFTPVDVAVARDIPVPLAAVADQRSANMQVVIGGVAAKLGGKLLGQAA